MFLLRLGGWFILSCILMSFVEHQVHRTLMHRSNFLGARTAFFKRAFETHYAEIFSDEPEDQEIRLTVPKTPTGADPPVTG